MHSNLMRSVVSRSKSKFDSCVQAENLTIARLYADLVEDRAVNLRAARQLGMRTVYVADGGPPAPEADVSIGSVLELERALAALA